MVWFFLSPGLNHMKWVMISDCLMLHDVTCFKAPIARISSKTLRHFSTSLNRLTCHLAGCGLESKTSWYRNLGIWSDCGSEWASGFRRLEERCEVMDWMGWFNVQWLVRRLNKSISFSTSEPEVPKYPNLQLFEGLEERIPFRRDWSWSHVAKRCKLPEICCSIVANAWPLWSPCSPGSWTFTEFRQPNVYVLMASFLFLCEHDFRYCNFHWFQCHFAIFLWGGGPCGTDKSAA